MDNGRAIEPKRGYLGKVAIRKIVETARELGLDVAGLSVAPDGTVTVMEARAIPQPEGTLFDRLQAEGKI